MSPNQPPKTASPSEPSNWVLIRRMLALGLLYKWGCIRLLILQGLLLVTALTVLRLTGLGIDLVHHFADPEKTKPPEFPFGIGPPIDWPQLAQIAFIAALILLVELLRAALNYTNALYAGYLIHTRIVVDLRAKVYDKLQRLSFSFFDTNATGSIINRVTSDVQGVRAFVDGVLIQLVILVLSFLCYLAAMISVHPWLTVACLATTPLMWLVTAIFSRMVRPMYDRNRELVDKVILRLAESIQGVQVIKGFGREQEEIDRFADDNREVKDQQRGIFWRVSVFTPIIGWMTQINLVILLAYGGYLVTRGELALGSGIFFFAGLLQQFSSQVANLTNIANSVQQSLSGARRVFEILDAPEAITSPTNPVRLPRVKGDVEFDGVWFEYTPGNPVVKDVSFRVQPGQRVAILGATGAGKSTLLSLLCRFYDPTQGQIMLDGIDLKEIDLTDLRRNIGMVFQESFMFSNTVAAISGGQRQRLAIARAVLLDPAILLLDDPAAAIDPHTEHEILDAMQRAMLGRTTFVVAHRLSTLRQCDLVIVLDNGRIAQVGTHEKLMEEDGHYREAALSQCAA
ncbi:MAG: ABC transporter ATP-binding protein/permease [Planctomycetales bacterium]|nr:ABC transporter ATP-binding protein/permease [Planctomycetales bacterium]